MTRPTRADAAGRAYLEVQNLAHRPGRSTQALRSPANDVLPDTSRRRRQKRLAAGRL